ncbi:tyrosine-type recombinase/integrase [Arsukibacterium sp. UBA3155]|uniref:tyrosine-type recombinase/integrase n=1 Tax=Arsukibacterium sp. UBA3155 TaxID=1946058 RepID=UPI0025C4A802|nr:site-specific integrase [Arsukibacterium sp. UBA3155]|tara:strand:+ start:113888 stop:115102 length:1215 start_codon:yes stop_codon:yes gene_type:complete
MGSLTVKKVESLIKGIPGKYADGGGLYLAVPKSGLPFWFLRYSINGKRREMTLAKCANLSLTEARAEAVMQKKQLVVEKVDPLFLKQRAKQHKMQTVDDLFVDWHKGNVKRLKHHNIPERVYRKDIAPHIGAAAPNKVVARDIQYIIESITESGRPTTANDALLYLKQLFNHGIKLDVVGANPASAFNVSDAGGVELSKDRALTLEELTQVFKVFRENRDSFARENYLACALLVTLGVRKGELTEASWQEFDLEAGIWELPKARSKSGVGLTIPLPELCLSWLEELYKRAAGSPYVFPNRRSSKNPYMGADTLNRAITKLFGHEAGKKKQPPNKMGDIKHFSVHDLRRTCRTLLAQLGVSGHVAERCLNHKLKGVEGIYNKHDYLDERREALVKLSKYLSSIIS